MSINDLGDIETSLTWRVIADVANVGNVSVEDVSGFSEFQISGIKGTANVLSATFLGTSFRARQTTLSFYNGTNLSLFNVSVTNSTTLNIGTISNLDEVVIRAR